ncbi:MAG: SLBB domain-containing protein [Gemmatimonadaceae bacterium]
MRLPLASLIPQAKLMPFRHLRSLLVAACFLSASRLGAQVPTPTVPPTQRPTADQARILLQTRPDLVAQLRQRFVTAGMTKEQVHERLRAAGYPEDLLDPYLPGATGEVTPTDSVYSAVLALGIADSTDVATLQTLGALADTSKRSLLLADSLNNRLDSLKALKDSLALKTQRDSGFIIFGMDVFKSNTTTQFNAAVAGPVDANYRLGPGDRLVLILTGDVESSYQLEVTREGFVVVPQVGQIYVANLTLGQLEQVMATRLARVYSGVRGTSGGSTKFSISVARLRANQVYVVGDVQRPNSYTVSSAGTALTALYAAGGPSINGSLRRIEIRRGGRLVDTLDVYDYLTRGDASHDARLETGDIVFVPVHGARVRIVGEIVRPATYELKGTETLHDLITYAGGFQANASAQRVVIDRIVPATERVTPGRDRVTVEVTSAQLLSATGPMVPLHNGDVVRVFPISRRVRNRITVAGNVYQPGPEGLTPGMKLSDALRQAGGVQPDTYLGEVLITRVLSDSTHAQLRAQLADTAGNVVNDLLLQEDDSIQVFSLSSFRPQRYVAIGGAVRVSGRFPYRAGMTLRDLVLRAGGVLESAYLREAEIARLPETRDGGLTATTIRVPLDSTYLFERKADGTYIGPPGLPFPASGSPDVVLRPYDNVLILRQPNWELQRTVTIQGEVRYPGSYALKTKSERLSDLITRAGGLTDEAYADGIVFSRTQGSIGRVGVELSAALRRYESSDNLILRDGDNITVPAYNSVVSIRGAVNQPSTVAYVRGRGIDYYISAAGGPSKLADESRAYVVQPSGKLESVRNRFLLPSTNPQPRPGSVVTVPEKDPNDRKDYVAIAGAVASVLASTTAIIIAISRRP